MPNQIKSKEVFQGMKVMVWDRPLNSRIKQNFSTPGEVVDVLTNRAVRIRLINGSSNGYVHEVELARLSRYSGTYSVASIVEVVQDVLQKAAPSVKPGKIEGLKLTEYVHRKLNGEPI